MSDLPNYPDMIVMPPGRYFFGDPRAVIKDDAKWAALLDQSNNFADNVGELDGYKVVAYPVSLGNYKVRAKASNQTPTVLVRSGFVGMVHTNLSDDVKALYQHGSVFYISDKTACLNDNGTLRFAVSRYYLISSDPKCYGQCLDGAVIVETAEVA